MTAAVALAIGFLAMPTQVFACDCTQMAPREAETYADVAFIGVVTQIEDGLPVPIDDLKGGTGIEGVGGFPGVPFPAGQLVHFRVESIQKGALDATSETVVQTGPDDCGMSFNVGERWQIYASGGLGYLWTGQCSGNVLLANNGSFPLLPFNLSPLFLVPLLVLVVGGAAVVGYRRG
jgi:hypothetical protein